MTTRKSRTTIPSVFALVLCACAGCGPMGPDCDPADEECMAAAAEEGDEGDEVGSVESALQGGTELSGSEHQTGVFRISTYDGSSSIGSCTATVLHASVRTNRTWLVTAAHCFSHMDSTTKFVSGHATTPRASVRYHSVGVDCSGNPKSGRHTCWSDATKSTVYQHPAWLGNGGHTAWFGPQDIAFVRINQALPVYDEANMRRPTASADYNRPIFAGHPTLVSSPFVPAQIGEYAFCGQGSGWLRCDRLTNLWYSPNFRHQFLQLPNGAWTGGFYEGGDSGGPLVMSAAGFGTPAGTGDLRGARHGVVLGVLQGPTVFCDYIQNGNCNPSDGLATHFYGIEGFLTQIGAINEIQRRYQLVDPDRLVYSSDHPHGGNMWENSFWMPVGGPCRSGATRSRFTSSHSGHGACYASHWTSSDPKLCQAWVLVKNSAGFLNGTCHVRIYEQ